MVREELNAPFLRHGDIAELSKLIENGEKPPYDEFVKFVQGEIDPPVEEEATRVLIRNKLKDQQESRKFDLIICSPALRAQQTSELIKQELDLNCEIHHSEYLREIKMPMDDITPEFYNNAKDVHEVRAKFIESFLGGKKVDEDIVDTFKRASNFLTYFRRVRKWTTHQPLMVTHGMFSRFVDLATKHQGEELNDEQIKSLVQQELKQTRRPDTLGGFTLSSSTEGFKILDLV